MNRSQMYIDSILEAVSRESFDAPASSTTILGIKERIAYAEDLDQELRILYRVEGFGDFALYLMWLARQVEEDPSKLEASPEERSYVSSTLRDAMGEPRQEAAPEAEETPFPTESESEIEFPAAPQEAGDVSPGEGTTEAPPEFTESLGSMNDVTFPVLLERFVEAMQHGDDERLPLMEALLKRSSSLSGSLDEPEDFRQLCEELETFLRYVREKEYMDDVRVMNILSNISGSVESWDKADPSARAGLLTEGVSLLRDFKTHFE